MIAWESCVVDVMVCRMIELRESNAQERLWMDFILLWSEPRCIDQITSKLFNIRLIKFVDLIKPCFRIRFDFKLKPNVITYSNFSHIAIC